MTIVCGIDPGPEKSAIVRWDGCEAFVPRYLPNLEVRAYIEDYEIGQVAVEWVHCYGRAVGEEVFRTAWWAGRFCELAFHGCGETTTGFQLFTRRDVCRALIGDQQAKKAQVNAYLRDTFGPVGTKKKPGPLYGVSGHVWDALAVAVVAHRGLNGAKP